MKKNRLIPAIVWALIPALFIFLTLNRHSRTGILNYHSEIFADKAGYYVYLPATFIYHFNVSSFPDSIADKTGNGFSLDTVNNIIRTKYPYGVALLQTPFFLSAHWLAKPLGFENNGFSLPYNRSVDIAGVFYFLAGLYFLWRFLTKYHSKRLSFFTLFFTITATNLYYYAIDETGMSHIYSFAIFSALLWMFEIFDIKKTVHILNITVLIALLFTVRPINIIFILGLASIKIKYIIEIIQKGFRQIHTTYTILAVIPAILIVAAQFTYWKYISGSLFPNPYPGESFTFAASPQLFKIWFSTNNGLFIYTPAWFLIISGMLVMIFSKNYRGWIYLGFFLFLSYVLSSWWNWWLGCSFGHRGYVEYLTVFVIPAVFLWNKLSGNRLLQFLIITLLVIFSIYNLQLTYVWDGCWYGNTWDFRMLWNKFLSAF